MTTPPTEPTTNRPKPPVITDVARLAKVSHQTVSRVLNSHPNVRESTRRRVEEAIEQLGYRPNVAARALVTRRSRIIGVVTPSVDRVGPRSSVLGLEEAARERGYSISIESLRDNGDNGENAKAAVDRLLNQGVDAIALVSPYSGIEPPTTPQDVPVVVIGHLGGEVPGIVLDQFAGASAATRHLIELGHVAIGHVAGLPNWYDEQARAAGWRSELAAADLSEPVALQGDWTPRSGYECAQAVAESGVTAVFVSNDQMAIGLVRGLAELGLRVPDDVSVVGFDDIPEAEFVLPPLTTVRQDFMALGRRGVEVLMSMMGGVGGVGGVDGVGGVGEAGTASSTADATGLPVPLLVARDSTAARRA